MTDATWAAVVAALLIMISGGIGLAAFGKAEP
jgi:hypothetical protein